MSGAAQEKTLGVPAKAPPGLSLEAMKAFVRKHFDDFVNHKDSGAALRNFTPDFLDHDEAYGPSNGNDLAKEMMEHVHKKWPDLHVTVEDAIAEDDIVVVRNRWHFTDPASGQAMEFHGFVQWRFVHGKICERWATITSPAEAASGVG